MKVAGNLYAMNAKGAYGYGFNVDSEGVITKGMFLDYDEEALRFHGVIFLKDRTFSATEQTFSAKTLWDVGSGETRELK
jgi:hypothetical protein